MVLDSELKLSDDISEHVPVKHKSLADTCVTDDGVVNTVIRRATCRTLN